MALTESGITVEATNDNRAGLMRFDLSNMRSDAQSFYVIVIYMSHLISPSRLTI